ncbi:NO-inducible flavohemoprotein [Sporosarcina sp. ANT_H38]|uniref:NO-inducible flavohemoprotein n=1 Tax=Sporosarcina sp. ANT_H38 TaxID=2597358 RepID=UPI0011F3966C|nr:NO-inducible flavohemoprotein [Sporosarcina sp. ANT_H38]KAA0948466.1 NO-inducible flavohemoprotein [Sporosarcina sp. ANT_H38]
MLSEETIAIIKSTVPVLEQHGKTITTVFYKNLFEAHPELLNIFNHVNQAQGRQQNALAGLVYAAAANIDNLGAVLPAVVQVAHKHKSLNITPEQYPIVGHHLLGAIKEVLGEAATPEIIGAWGEAYEVIAGVFISIEKEMYAKAEEMDGGWKTFKDFEIADKVVESDVITSFYLKPVDGKKLPSYKPGQYITLRVTIPGEEYILNRQYSLSQAPTGESYRISVKREDEITPNGKMSVNLHNAMNVGDTVGVSVPAGVFHLDTESNNPVTLISGGVGITPMMSMFDSIAKNTPERSVAFLHSARTRKHQAFDAKLRTLSESMPTSTYAVLYSEEGDGFINRDFLAANVIKGSDIYVCGPTPFMQAVIKDLYAIGISKEKINFEFFGPAEELELANV